MPDDIVMKNKWLPGQLTRDCAFRLDGHDWGGLGVLGQGICEGAGIGLDWLKFECC